MKELAVGYNNFTTVETLIVVCVTSVAVTSIDCTWHYAWVVAVVVGRERGKSAGGVESARCI